MQFKVDWHDRLGSTNTYMKQRFIRESDIPSGSIVATREQTAGRGRQERKWLSAPDTNLCFSLFIATPAELMAVPSLTMAIAMAVSEMLNRLRIPAAPKWPNDVLVDGKKICGILSERVESGDSSATGIIVGIGLNVNMSSVEAEAIDRPATSMLIVSSQAHDLCRTLESLFQPLEHWIEEWKQGGFPRLRESWTQQAGPIGKRLTVHDGDVIKSGTLAGFGDHGELLLNTENGVETIWSGDVSA
ncbi:biotin--[acetyl-CoA-carboxylase] ligase [Pontiella sulfatireligans]|uniref:biotin--[biotin carboxyl-carrier protein] ligase n=1 Tax=Pontiella sulfatireligans TaxID=2750658 RepID=A0A6C2URY1_9BACT|nr:biotin--[acetyl-CoA-carboxylase] ligase [Pontiella sulfatireligans]VGO23100.1 Bifunctional ligase/repressor BirA [Pontiella sulfatireligans]